MNIEQAVEIINRLNAKPDGFATAYGAGFDAGINGPSIVNCDFRWFGSQESMREWERGNKAGKRSGETK